MWSSIFRSEPGPEGDKAAAAAAAGGQGQDRDPQHGANVQERGGTVLTPTMSGEVIIFKKTTLLAIFNHQFGWP
jgi:hypothetical protein